jgi:hypothetical protein
MIQKKMLRIAMVVFIDEECIGDQNISRAGGFSISYKIYIFSV